MAAKKISNKSSKNLLSLIILICIIIFGSNSIVHASDPLYPNLKVLPPRDLRFDRTDVSVDNSGDMHNVLRFSNTVYNAGEGKMEMWGDIDPNTKDGTAYQRVYNSDGSYTDYSVGRFYYHAQHDHYHFEDWGQYQLWTKAEYDAYIASGGSDGDFNYLGSKTTSCVLDEEFIQTYANNPPSSVYPYTGCIPNAQNKLLEGLSVGWGDTYDYYRYEQWIDLGQATLTDGDYVLRTITDPLNKMYESAGKADSSRENLTDNTAITPFTISGGQLVDSMPPSGTVSINGVSPTTLVKNVTVKVIGRDDVSGVDQVLLSNDGVTWATYAYTGIQSVAQSIPWDLTDPAYGGNNQTGVKTVYAKFHDISGKYSSTSDTDTITYGTPSQVSDYSNAVTADAPVSYWRLSETSGTTAFDSMGNNPGTYNNSPILGTASLIISDSASNSVTFDGVNDSVSIPTNTNYSDTAVSLEAWIKPIAFPTGSNYASVATKSGSYSLQFSGSRLEFKVGSSSRVQAPIGAISIGQTYHIVGTYDSTSQLQKLYINGLEVASKTLTGTIPGTGNLRIGAWSSSSELFNGTIDEVALYSTALSNTKIKNHYDIGVGNIVTAPETQIDTQPASLSNNTTADFTFSSPSPTVTFECSLDSAAFAACASPQHLTQLSNAVHNFKVRARDSIGNTDSTPASYTWTIDLVAPTVTSFTRQVPLTSPTNADELIFRVTFNEAVTGLAIADFSINGSTTATITKVGVVNVSVYDVTIKGGNLASFNGTIGLSFNAPTITDIAGNPFINVEPTTNETYTLDNIAPTITSFIRQNPSTSTTNADLLVFRATFSEAVTGVAAADFAVNGTTTATVTNVNPVNASVYDVTVSGGNLATFNDTVGLNFNAPSVADLGGNTFANVEPATDEVYTVQNSPIAYDSALDISINGTVKGTYTVLKDHYLLATYKGSSGGPLSVDSTNNVPDVASIRLLYLNQFGTNTLSELMGVPTSGLLDNYWMPLYLDDAVMDSQIRFTNTSPTLSTDVSVYIGGVLKGTYTLAPNSATRVRYQGFSGGPVQIVGTPGVPILAGMRIIYAGGNSFDEIMAYPTTQLSNEYWFPFYNHNNVNLDTEIRVGNTSPTLSSTVDVYIGGALKGTYTLAPNTSKQISYPGFFGGPVRIVGTVGVPIVSSMRLLYLNQYSYFTLSELMGVPTSQLLDNYAMPVYLDDTVMDSQVRFTNTSTTLSTTVNVYLGANLMGTYVMPPSSANRIRFTGVSGGPVRIVGTPGVPILAGMRIIYEGGNSFDEIMAYPTTLLSPEYWFPFYNHNMVNLDTEVRIGVP